MQVLPTSSSGLRAKPKREFVSRRPFLVALQRRHYFDHQPAVPVMSETLLQLDLLLQQRFLNLSMITETILGDLGATLQVMRATAQERAASKWTECRVEDCVVHLGSDALRRTLSLRMSSLSASRRQAAKRLWRRAQITAELSRSLVRDDDNISSAGAHVAGLLHEIGSLPALLGWKVAGIDVDDTAVVRAALTEEWGMPSGLPNDVSGSTEENSQSRLFAKIVATAGDLTAQSIDDEASMRCVAGSTLLTLTTVAE